MGRMLTHAGKKGNERKKQKEHLNDCHIDYINDKVHLEATVCRCSSK